MTCANRNMTYLTPDRIGNYIACGRKKHPEEITQGKG
jgi:hypothetical protein